MSVGRFRFIIAGIWARFKADNCAHFRSLLPLFTFGPLTKLLVQVGACHSGQRDAALRTIVRWLALSGDISWLMVFPRMGFRSTMISQSCGSCVYGHGNNDTCER